ncbi:UbiA prenyltransferase family [Xylariomycetidae sp. FL2044]|nr:UbiA prenyltransferase family [Xylariomycetidae sp. FL2044]
MALFQKRCRAYSWTILSLVLAGLPSLMWFVLGFVWLELHLLTFDVKNQILGVEEDRYAKPYRPIVSGRISSSNAEILYQCLVVLCLAYTALLHNTRLVLCSVIYLVAIFLHNEGGLGRNWLMKGALSAIGYMCYCWGTATLFNENKPLPPLSSLALLMSGAIFTTTGHAQDFRDRTGDAAIGRRTLPLVLPPWAARGSLALFVNGWTVVLIRLWHVPFGAAMVFAALGVVSTAKFMLDHDEKSDRDSYFWYNLWLISAHLLPVFRSAAIMI